MMTPYLQGARRTYSAPTKCIELVWPILKAQIAIAVLIIIPQAAHGGETTMISNPTKYISNTGAMVSRKVITKICSENKNFSECGYILRELYRMKYEDIKVKECVGIKNILARAENYGYKTKYVSKIVSIRGDYKFRSFIRWHTKNFLDSLDILLSRANRELSLNMEIQMTPELYNFFSYMYIGESPGTLFDCAKNAL